MELKVHAKVKSRNRSLLSVRPSTHTHTLPPAHPATAPLYRTELSFSGLSWCGLGGKEGAHFSGLGVRSHRVFAPPHVLASGLSATAKCCGIRPTFGCDT
eukprot:1889990-Rhodomonas_salina.4